MFCALKPVDAVCQFVATVYTRLFQFLAIPTVALAIMTTLISFGKQRSTRRIFAHTIIDMVETAENVWSDSCVCAMTDKDLSGKES